MLNHSARLATSSSVLKALPVKLDIKRHSYNIVLLEYKVLTESSIPPVLGGMRLVAIIIDFHKQTIIKYVLISRCKSNFALHF